VCLFAKRLENAQFIWPRIGPARIQLNQVQALALLDGLDWKKVRITAVKTPEILG
jgi:transposase